MRNEPRVVIGDARLNIIDAPDGTYDVLVLDAFSSDSIPVHLITREAFALYLRKLAPGGRLLFHISSQTVDLIECSRLSPETPAFLCACCTISPRRANSIFTVFLP